eukprot:3312732-Heterocapsa_arctica.AAC.2
MVSADHVVSAEPDAGMQGERARVVVSDMGTESLAFYPMQRKTFERCAQSLKHFCGRQEMSCFSSDNAPELLKAALHLVVPHAASTPHRSSSNGKIENIIGQVLMGSRPLLNQAGLTKRWWSWAAPFYCDAHNILGKPGAQEAPHWQRQGKEFP